ncbi:DUF2953 domain-containing protein [Alicyclobacillus sp. SO9]|uniref:DUF2953 domain-containing protein n=1 Tax=Alicyclobacillus sp. SO9 TaxID=2665646 RepID=UPI0018E6E387|nr:DUF2953 domain-containing protein [Alicyclobacillus sp. SO9]QQE76905.1 DUF2953 domain-containing protein [Alicyclobacillus sp. SO9]
MWLWFFIAVFVFLILVILLWLSLTIEVSVSKTGSEFTGFVKFSYLFGLITVRKSFSDVKPTMTDEGPSLNSSVHNAKKSQHRIFTAEEAWKILKDWPTWVRKLRRFTPIGKWTLRKTKITAFSSKLTIGTGDAPSTGLAVGSAYGIIGDVVGVMSHYMRLERLPTIHVKPDFSEEVFDLSQLCILQIRVGYAMWAAIRSFRIWKSKRGQ